MDKIKGLKIEKLDFTINKKGDFLFFEGPLLSHFYDNDGNDYLLIWVDKDEKNNRWLLFRTDRIKLYEYLTEKYSLKKILELSNYEIVYFIDIDSFGDYKKIILTIKDNIPSDYQPSSKSYFKSHYAEKYALELKQELSNALLETPDSEILLGKISKLKENTEDTIKRFNLLSIKNNIINSSHEILTLKYTELPIYIHYLNSSSRDEYKHLISIRKSAYINPLDMNLYFTELNRILKHNTDSLNNVVFHVNNNNINLLFESLIISTINIIKNNPRKFNDQFVFWKNEVLSMPNLSDEVRRQLTDFDK